MHVVSELMEHDIEHYKIIEKMTENKTPAYFQQIQNALNMQYNEQFKYLYTTLPYCKESLATTSSTSYDNVRYARLFGISSV